MGNPNEYDVSSGDIVEMPDAGTLKDAINEVKSGQCLTKEVFFDGEALFGRSGTCVTKVNDKEIEGITFKITSEGDLIYLGANIHFVGESGPRVLIRTKCVDGNNCDLEKATTPLAQMFLEEFELMPVGNITVQVEGTNAKEIVIRAIEGSGQLQIFSDGEFVGVVDMPNEVEQDQGIENVGELMNGPKGVSFSVSKAIRETSLFGSDQKKKDQKTKASVGCNTGGPNAMQAPMSDPIAIMTAILILLAIKSQTTIAAIPAQVQRAVKKFAESIGALNGK